jgi:hypothetical protein
MGRGHRRRSNDPPPTTFTSSRNAAGEATAGRTDRSARVALREANAWPGRHLYLGDTEPIAGTNHMGAGAAAAPTITAPTIEYSVARLPTAAWW